MSKPNDLSLLSRLLTVTVFVVAAFFPVAANAQGPCGGKPCPRIIVTAPQPPPSRSPSRNINGRRNKKPLITPAEPKERVSEKTTVEVAPCSDAELVVVCHMPGCEITLDDQERHVTDDLGGFTFQVPGNHAYRLRVAKPGYDTLQPKVRTLKCGDQEMVSAELAAKPVTLKMRTIPAECDIFLDRQLQSTRSDSAGRFSYLLSKPTLLIEAKKSGYLSATQTIVLAPEWANREVVLELEPINARLKLAVNIDEALVAIDGKAKRSAHDQLSLRPGNHVITVEALGYTPVKFDLTVEPDQALSRDVTLERLPLSTLQLQAEGLLEKRAYDDVRKVSKYIFEADKENGVAHRLEGYVALVRGDIANAGKHFADALSAGEKIVLRIRRHLDEKFELNKGHEACEGQLVFSKNELEFQGLRNSSENFKVGFEQVQVGALQLKSSRALYLSTKVTINSKRRDYNFYGFDKELSQAAKPYLEMIQQLMRAH